VLAVAAGAEVVRVHDVEEVGEALRVAEAILGRLDWRASP
jgi:dihydropteroate synthase